MSKKIIIRNLTFAEEKRDGDQFIMTVIGRNSLGNRVEVQIHFDKYSFKYFSIVLHRLFARFKNYLEDIINIQSTGFKSDWVEKYQEQFK